MKNIFIIVLYVAVVVQLVMTLIAEYNDEYTRAIYEMMWAALFVFLAEKEKIDD